MFHKLRMTLFGVLLLSAMVLSMSMAASTAGTASASSVSLQNSNIRTTFVLQQKNAQGTYRYWWRRGYRQGYRDGLEDCSINNAYGRHAGYGAQSIANQAYTDGYRAGHRDACSY